MIVGFPSFGCCSYILTHYFVSLSAFYLGGLTLAELKRELNPICRALPILIKNIGQVSAISFNLWTESKVSNSKTSRSDNPNYRNELRVKLNYIHPKLPVCMVSGKSGNGEQVVCAHIVPCSSLESSLAKVGLTKADVASIRNCLFLAKGLETAFDNLQLSFIRSPTNPLNSNLFLKIWDDSCRSHKLWVGLDVDTIGDFDGKELVLNGHEPFKRALSYQAYQAYVNRPAMEQHDAPIHYGSPFKCFQQNQEELELLSLEFEKNVDEEVEDDVLDELASKFVRNMD